MIIDGKELALSIKKELAEQVKTFPEKYGRVPHLVVILIGNNPASLSYVRGKKKAAEFVGIKNTTLELDETISEKELLDIIFKLNQDKTVDAILVQLPLPEGIDEKKIMDSIAVEKDVDGFHCQNVGALWLKRPTVCPCTPKGIISLLKAYKVGLEGKRVVIVGRSNIVGLPLAKLFIDANATVTICHSKTKELPMITRSAEILVVAIGRAHFIKSDMVSKGVVIIDVGINRDAISGKLVGDVNFDDIQSKALASLITPVPGGVGPMTICSLMENTIECFLRGDIA